MEDDPPGLVARAVRRLLLLLYRLRGWKAAGEPSPPAPMMRTVASISRCWASMPISSRRM